LIPDARVGHIAQAWEIDLGHPFVTGTGQDDDIVLAVASNLVEGVGKVSVSLAGKDDWPAVGVHLHFKYAVFSNHLEIVVLCEVVRLGCHASFSLRLLRVYTGFEANRSDVGLQQTYTSTPICGARTAQTQDRARSGTIEQDA
jgi:hypothetical protein